MRRSEIIQLITLCSANYRNWPEDGKESAVVELWETMLEDVEFDHGKLAVQKHMSESVYAPTIADIRAKISDISAPQGLTAMEAWGSVIKSIQQYGSYREAEAIQSLDPLVQKVVRLLGFRNLCMSENEMADRAHFTKAYDTIVNRDRTESLMPARGRALMEKLQLENVIKRIG